MKKLNSAVWVVLYFVAMVVCFSGAYILRANVALGLPLLISSALLMLFFCYKIYNTKEKTEECCCDCVKCKEQHKQEQE